MPSHYIPYLFLFILLLMIKTCSSFNPIAKIPAFELFAIRLLYISVFPNLIKIPIVIWF